MINDHILLVINFSNCSIDFLSRLNDYNTYYEGRPEQLRTRHNKNGEMVIDGLLNVYWGLRTAIRLQVKMGFQLRFRHINFVSTSICVELL